jgi:chromosomal replication initiator protein
MDAGTVTPTMAQVRRVVARYYDIPQTDLVGPSRYRMHARPRQMAYLVTRELTGRSYPMIGRMYGGRDHGTCHYGVRHMRALIARDGQLGLDRWMIEREVMREA